MRVKLPPSLLGRLNVHKAVADELQAPNTLLPSRVLENALRPRAPAVSRLVEAKAAQGYELEPGLIVWALKGRWRHRPAAALPITTRALYRALLMDVQPALPEFDRSGKAYDSFEVDILKSEASKVIGVTDVANFYRYIDHRQITDAIVDYAGRADTAASVLELLSGIEDNAFGLPQGPQPSDWLSELAIAPVERKLIRRGIPVTRFNDDFRLAGLTLGAVSQHLQTLQQELHSTGLTLNEEKTRVMGREAYEAHVGELERRFRETLSAALSDYHEAPEEEADSLLAGALANLFVEALGEGENQRLAGLEAGVNRRLLLTAIYHLTRLAHPGLLDHGADLIIRDPSFARPFGNYLRAVSAAAGDDVITCLVTIVESDPSQSGWAHAWLMQPLLNTALTMPDTLLHWVRRLAATAPSSLLRARALLVLAMHGEIDVAVIGRQMELAPEAAQPDLIAAAAVSQATKQSDMVAAFRGESQIAEWIFTAARRRRAQYEWF